MERQQLREREAKRPRYDSPKRDARGAYGDDAAHRQYNSELQMEAVVAMSCIQQPGSTPAQAWSDLPTVSIVPVSCTEKPDQPAA